MKTKNYLKVNTFAYSLYLEGKILGEDCTIYDEGGHTKEQGKYICKAVSLFDDMSETLRWISFNSNCQKSALKAKAILAKIKEVENDDEDQNER